MINLLYYKKFANFELKKLCYENQSKFFAPWNVYSKVLITH
jgi:hypothetical protein